MGVLFDVQVRETDAIAEVSVLGDVDVSVLPQVVAVIDSLSAPSVTIDLCGVDWFDPVCLGVLLSAHLRASRRGGALKVLARGGVADLLVDTGVAGVVGLSEVR